MMTYVVLCFDPMIQIHKYFFSYKRHEGRRNSYFKFTFFKVNVSRLVKPVVSYVILPAFQVMLLASQVMLLASQVMLLAFQVIHLVYRVILLAFQVMVL